MNKQATNVSRHSPKQLETAYHEMVAYAQELEDEVERQRRADAKLEPRTTKLALVNGIGRRITAILDLNELLDTTVILLQEVFAHDHVALFLLENRQLKLEAVAGVYAEKLDKGRLYEVAGNIIADVVNYSKTIIINDTQLESHYTPFVVKGYDKTRSELCLPLLLGDSVLGVLDIQSYRPKVFDENDVLALEALANQIAVAIENARLHQQVQLELQERKETEKTLHKTLEELRFWADEKAPDLKRTNKNLRQQIDDRKQSEAEIKNRAHQQAVVAKFGQRVLAGIDMATLTDEVVVLLAETLNVEYCQILELQPDVEDVLLLKAGVGWKDGLVGRLRIRADTNSQMGYTLLSSEPVVVENIHTETRFHASPHLREHNVVSSMSVIIDSEDWPFGVLGVHTAHPRTFTKDDINFLQAMANIFAQAMERIRAETALRDSEEKYRTLIEKSSDAIFLIYGGHFEVINHRFTELFGVTKEQANEPDFTFSNIVASKGRRIVENLQHSGKGHQGTLYPVPYEFTAIDKDGNEIEVELRVSYPFYRGGLATQGLIRDITERKRMELEREQTYKQIQQYTVELSEKIEEVQRQREIATKLAEVVASISLTLSTDEILSHILLMLKQLIAYDSAAIFLVKEDNYLVMKAAKGFGDDVLNQEFTYTKNVLFKELRDSKSYIHIADTRLDDRYQFWLGATEVRCWIGAPLLVAQDMIGYLTVDCYEPNALGLEDADVVQAFAHQVAQTIYNARLFEQLNKTQTQLIQRERLAALGQMAATVAHELRNPLMAIKIGVEYLVHDIPEDDPRQRGANLMQANMERIDSIINDILYVARAPKPNLTPGSLYSVLENEVAYWKVDLAERGIEFQHQLLCDAPPVMLDIDQIGRVFSNIIRNGADAVGPEGELKLTMTCEDGFQIVTIEDNGPGIPLENQEKIFEPFFTTKSRGTGLGLAIVKQIVENHRGEITLWSEPGVGTKFTITLPDAEPAG